jgi:hypothetical protein
VGQHIYERIDGVQPSWRLIYTNSNPGHSETGLRGLTAIPGPSGYGVLLAAIEGNAGRIVRIDPRDKSEATEVDLSSFLAGRWGMRAGYTIAAYNDMARVPETAGGEALLIGIEAFIPPGAAIAAGHNVVDVGYGRVDASGWFLVRHPTGQYDLRQVAVPSGRALVSIRAIRLSPWQSIYFAGYDANKAPAHDTAWIMRATVSTALGERPR